MKEKEGEREEKKGKKARGRHPVAVTQSIAGVSCG